MTADELQAMRRLVDERFRELIEADRAATSASGTQHEQRACLAMAEAEARLQQCGVDLYQVRNAWKEGK